MSSVSSRCLRTTISPPSDMPLPTPLELGQRLRLSQDGSPVAWSRFSANAVEQMKEEMNMMIRLVS